LELPETFLNTLEKDQNNQPILWHPSLEMTKIYSHENNQALPVLKEKPSGPNSNFLSLIQVKQDQGIQNLVYVPGSDGNDTAIKSTSLNCKCHFVKDPNGIYLFQQLPSIVTEVSQESSPSAAKESNNQVKTLNAVSLAGNEEDGSSGPSLLRGIISNDELGVTQNNGKSGSNSENALQKFIERNQLLDLQLENEQLKEELGRGKKQEQVLKLMELLKGSGGGRSSSDGFRLYENSNQFQDFLEEESQRKNEDNYELLLLLNLMQRKQKEERQGLRNKLMFLLGIYWFRSLYKEIR